MVFLDVFVDTHEVVTVEVYQFTAVQAFEVEMLTALVLIFDVLIAGTGLAVDDKFAHTSRLYEFVELTVYGSGTERRPLRREVSTDLLNSGMLVLVIDKEIDEFFLLFGVISGFSFHIRPLEDYLLA